jgi:hypothetical protein
MVLPDRKIAFLHRFFSGETLPEVVSGGDSFWGRRRAVAGMGRRRPVKMTLGDLLQEAPQRNRASQT